MKIMIVDDEVIIRTGLAQVINWEELGLELLKPAASAEEALERIPRERPNILLTDIRMSGKSGLQLAEEAKRLIPDLEVIILSGYDDFIYTQQAIRQDVSDYLLKTSRPEEIIKTALRAKQRIEEKWAELSQERIKNKEARNRLFERLVVEGHFKELDLQLIRAVLPKAFKEGEPYPRYQVFILAAEGWTETDRFESLLLFAVDNMLNELLDCETLLQRDRIVVLAFGCERSGSCLPARTVLEKIERLLKCRLTAAGGKQVDKMEELRESYATAEYAFSYRGLIAEKVWDYEQLKRRKGGKRACTHEEELELSAILLKNDQVALNNWVQRFLQDRLEDPHMTLESLEASLHSAAATAQRWLQRALAMTGRAEAAEESAAQLHLKLEDKPREALFRYLYATMKLYHNRLAEGQTTHVQKAMAYIQDHLEDDVGLPQVAKHVHLHPSHLSELFRKETGMTFGEYVTRQKIERAKELLAVSPAKISEIAARLGYEDVKYFGQLFKKYTGKTPSEFRGEAVQTNGRSE
jgi:two-component system response regulator YesN